MTEYFKLMLIMIWIVELVAHGFFLPMTADKHYFSLFALLWVSLLIQLPALIILVEKDFLR